MTWQAISARPWLEIDIHGVLAIGGASGIAIGFAAQKLVSNLIAGLLIFVTQPFKAGDRIQVQGIVGIVQGVG